MFKGFYESIPNEQYHAAPGLSRSGLMKFAISPAHYRAYTKKTQRSTPDQVKYSMVHMAILEPDEFDKKIKIIDGNRNRKDVRAQIECAELDGKVVLKSQDLKKVIKARYSFRHHSLASDLIQNGWAEPSLFWEENGLLFKARPDFLCKDGVIVDLKCFYDLRVPNLQWQIKRQKYHWQAYFYLKGFSYHFEKQLTDFYFVYIETEEPYGVKVTQIDQAALEKAEHEMEPLLERYKWCFENNEWPNYDEVIEFVTLPDLSW